MFRAQRIHSKSLFQALNDRSGFSQNETIQHFIFIGKSFSRSLQIYLSFNRFSRTEQSIGEIPREIYVVGIKRFFRNAAAAPLILFPISIYLSASLSLSPVISSTWFPLDLYIPRQRTIFSSTRSTLEVSSLGAGYSQRAVENFKNTILRRSILDASQISWFTWIDEI